MSKYTTEVRFICEHNAGLSESVGYTQIDSVVEKSWDKIFNDRWEIFDESYRALLCQKILKHFYLREIGAETVGIWKFWLNQRMSEIMPYYNKLYKAELLEFNPFYDTDLTRTYNKVADSERADVKGSKETHGETVYETRKSNGSFTNKNNIKQYSKVTNKNNSDSTDLFSDTPQGSITDLQDNTYLTNARIINQNGGSTDAEKMNGSENRSGSSNTSDKGKFKRGGNRNFDESLYSKVGDLENYLEMVKGKAGGGDYSSLLMKYRQTFINIDMMVIEELNDLFMGIW